jgi:hypothetical protein
VESAALEVQRLARFLGLALLTVQRQRKFSAVFGTTSVYSWKTIRPAGWPPIETSKNTRVMGKVR